MSHKIEGLQDLNDREQIRVLASLLKDKIKEVNTIYWKHNNPVNIRVFFWDNEAGERVNEAAYGLYTGGDENRISLLNEHFKTEN